MDIANFGANFSMAREHLTLFAFLVFALPFIGFAGAKLWIAARASKSQRRRDWFVPVDFNSEAARLHYSMGNQSVAFVTARRHPRHTTRRSSGR